MPITTASSRLALHGGTPIRNRPFTMTSSIGEEEKRAAVEVLESGVLSQFLGFWAPEFYGGPRVRELERAWAERFGVKHAISVNSATSGLYAAVGALDLRPGDEVIVTPYTMTASATGIILYGGTPVFADITPDTFNLDPDAVRRAITPRTKAIVVVDLLGHPAELDEIRAIAIEHRLRIIEDAAQAPGALYRGRPAGTLGDMGVFSLNYHKTIHSGEGGMIVTDDDDLAERLQLIRNHGEIVVKEKGSLHLDHLIGFNYRMTEIEAAIAREQLRKLDALTEPRVRSAALLTRRLASMPYLTTPVTKSYATHVFYRYAIRYDSSGTGIPRSAFVRALKAEGIPVYEGYTEPLYLAPIYHSGRRWWNGDATSPSYDRGTCPVVERMFDSELFHTDVIQAHLTEDDADDVGRAVEKVMRNADLITEPALAR